MPLAHQPTEARAAASRTVQVEIHSGKEDGRTCSHSPSTNFQILHAANIRSYQHQLRQPHALSAHEHTGHCADPTPFQWHQQTQSPQSDPVHLLQQHSQLLCGLGARPGTAPCPGSTPVLCEVLEVETKLPMCNSSRFAKSKEDFLDGARVTPQHHAADASRGTYCNSGGVNNTPTQSKLIAPEQLCQSGWHVFAPSVVSNDTGDAIAMQLAFKPGSIGEQLLQVPHMLGSHQMMLEVGSIYKGPGRAIVQKSNPHDAQLLQQVGTPLCFTLA
ncbi:MAG: hypothetical protein FRX49_06272 [Trebouxia sp. A1-2]|nr:MAG: hypothetical protein FRX49_06272 [Trebouxia sp. A1-2]